MELKELTTRTLELLGIETTDKMPARLFGVVQNNDQKIYEQFVALVDGDLTVDWLQMIGGVSRKCEK